MADGVIQMTRAQYEQQFGSPVPEMVPVATSQPIKMTRAEYQQQFGAPVPTTPQPNFFSDYDQMSGPQKAATTVLGGVANLGNAIYAGLGDEAIAAASAPILAFQYGKPIGEAYDVGLEMTRGARDLYREQSPVGAVTADVVGAIKSPLTKVMGAVPAAVTVPGKIGSAAMQGAIQGGAYGFGEAEGGVGERAQQALSSGALGGAISGVIAAPLAFAQKAGPRIVETGKALGRKSLGARASDYAKTVDEISPFGLAENANVETLTKRSLDDLVANNKLGASRNPEDMLRTALKKTGELAGQINDEITSVQTKVAPRFDGTLKYLEKGKVPADQVANYTKKVQKLAKAIQEKGKGSLEYLQQQKIAIGEKYKPGEGVANGFWRAVYKDLQTTIEKHAPEVKGLNKELQKYKIALPILKRGLASDETSDLTSTIIQKLRTSGGHMTTPVIIGTALGGGTGYATGGGEGAKAGMLAGAGLGLAASPTGQAYLGRQLVQLGSKTGGVSSWLPAIIGQQVASPAYGSEQATQLDPYTMMAAQQGFNNSMEGYNAYSNDELAFPKKTSEPREVETKQPKVDQVPFDRLVTAVIAQESGGNSEAESEVGAQGLMQLMPATGRELAKKVGVRYDPYNPEQNKMLGSLYLQQMLDQFNGDVELALTAYHSGPGRVQELLNEVEREGKARNLQSILPRLGPVGQKYARQVINRIKKA